MGPLPETTDEAGLLMGWSMDSMKSPADGGHSHHVQDSHPTGSELLLPQILGRTEMQRRRKGLC